MNGEFLTYGLVAEFATGEELIKAAERARAAGYRKMEGYSPYPLEELPEALGRPESKMPVLMFLGGLAGGLGAFGMMYYACVCGYPLNVGGRPLDSWPAFVPIIFELTVLISALTGFIGLILLNRLPQPYHPLFNVPQFERASQDRFFLCIESGDEQFDGKCTRQFLADLQPLSVTEVPP